MRSDNTWPPCPAAVGGVNPGSSAIGTTATGSPSSATAGAQPEPEDHGDVVLVDAGAIADSARRLCGQRIRSGHSRASLARQPATFG